MQNNIKAEGKARSSSVVMYKNNLMQLRDIQEILPKGHQMCQAANVFWHELPLYLMVEKRIDKQGHISFAYQFTTYKTKKPVQIIRS